MQAALARTEFPQSPWSIAGKAWIVRGFYERRNMSPVWDKLVARLSDNPSDAAAFMDASIILQTAGDPENAAVSQKAALEISQTYRIQNGQGSGLNVLAFVTAGDFMANTPLEFLLEQSHTNILLHYVDADTPDLLNVPAHDVAFVAIGESPDNIAVLQNLERLLSGWSGAIMNNAPHRIIDLTRDKVADTLRGQPAILAPATARVERAILERVEQGELELLQTLIGCAYPLIVRPVGTHAGEGMEKISCASDLSGYLGRQPEPDFYLSPFIDYSSADGKFRKQRIAFIDGRAYASHLAVSDHWMVHYLSAGMAEYEDRRMEEAEWMANFDTDFAVRHASAFDALYRHFGLDYFAIDCAELGDGRLLLFEADVAMIVHSMDPATVFPYKKEPMRKLFAAFERALAKRVERANRSDPIRCAHTGKPPVYQRTDNDCLICALAMFTGRTYEEMQDIARSCDPMFPPNGPMSHSIMRGVANRCGIVLLSSIYMLWQKPAIIGVISPTIPDAGHAVLWDGEKIIDPGKCERVDRSYVDRCGLEFTQRAVDLEPLIVHDAQISYIASAVTLGEPS